MTVLQFVIIYIAGAAAGFMNVMAGGGSMVTLPVLMWIGLPPPVANATNRLGVIFESGIGVKTFRSGGMRFDKSVLPAIVSATIGSVIGSMFVSTIAKDVLEKVIAVTLLGVVLLMLLKPKRLALSRPSRVLSTVIFFGVGFYGGFLQAGVGFFLIGAITFSYGFDLVRTNFTKILIVFIYTVFALAIFILNGIIYWVPGLVLAAGNVVGAYFAAKLSIRKGSGFVKWILLIIVVVNAIRYLFF
ncbi:MAG TPA: sulfite exporter TauE/SafE family protein [Mesotoga infera]|uniref:Probable membrane transporter protein n=1 Tax=Mesotoga infera TaxID=1236046 RepID=A0A7C1CVY0_9BACT|nr:sulfite exporter TauE/SafE family protein [Mesotoga infera]